MKSQKALKIFNLRLGSKSVAPLSSMRRIYLAWFQVDRRWSTDDPDSRMIFEKVSKPAGWQTQTEICSD